MIIPEWAITLISVAASAAVSGIIGYLIKRSLDRYFAKKDANEKEKEEKLQELSNLRDERLRQQRRDDVREIVKEELKPVNDKVDLLTEKVSKTEEGTLSSLRNDILTCYYRCCEKGYRADWDFENIHHLYDAYDDLNGNSFVKDVMLRFDSLPTKEDYEKMKHKEILNEKK